MDKDITHKERGQSADTDLDATDKLPILEGMVIDHDVDDDAVPLEPTAVLPGAHVAAGPGTAKVPSLADSIRSVEDRLSRQDIDFDALTQSYERARAAELGAEKRADALAAELAEIRTALASERGRSRDLEGTLADKSGSIETAHTRLEEAQRESLRHQSESQRHQSELRTLRDSLAALEAGSNSAPRLDVELQAATVRANSLASDLQASRETVAALTAQVERSKSEVNVTRSDLGVTKNLASSYLELLRTREWRRGFDRNMFLEMDAHESVEAASEAGARADDGDAGDGTFAAERERLRGELAVLSSRLAQQLAAAETERTWLNAELAVRERKLVELREAGSGETGSGETGNGEAQTAAELLEAELRQKEHAAQAAQAAQAAHATQAAQFAQLRGELAAQIEGLQSEAQAQGAENRKLRGTLEQARTALKERESLIRRLEHSENTNANELGRIQRSIEKLGTASGRHHAGEDAPLAPAPAGAPTEWPAELIRIDGERPVTHVLSRRTRIGRSTGCEVQIDSSSVSRHHALVLVGPRETIIEDLNSTNGVLVNGRKVSRQVLRDGDAVTLGESRFRYIARPPRRSLSPQPAELAPIK